MDEAQDEEDTDETMESFPAIVCSAREELTQERDAWRKRDKHDRDNADKSDHGDIVPDAQVSDGDGNGEKMHEQQQKCAGGGAAMCHVHLVQPAKIGFRPFGACGKEKGKGQEDDHDRTKDLAGIAADKCIAAII